MKSISISIGPGQHGKSLVEIFLEAGLLKQSFQIYPELTAINFKDQIQISRKVFKRFGYFQYLLWAAWRRVPYYKRFQTPSALTFSYADKIIESNLEQCDLFIGWSQISLKSMKKARSFSANVLLEHPIIDVDKWTAIISEEHRRYGNGQGIYSLFPQRVIERMRKEREEADRINVLSTFAKNSLLEAGVSEEKIITTLLGTDTDKFSPPDAALTGRREKFRILYVGRLEILKGIQYLLQAFSRIKGKDIELCLIGQVLPEMEPILKQFDDERIKIMGPVPADELPKHYQNADLFIFPSVNDSFGLVVLEAMSCGLPVIATENCCGQDVITDGEDGFVIPIRNPQAIQDKIEFFLDNREVCSIMGTKARDKVLNNFTAAHYKARLLRNIENCLTLK